MALALAREGYFVYGAARRPMPELTAAGGQALALDVTDDASLVAAVDQITQAHGRIDVLINAAGYGQYGAIEDVPMHLARRQLDVNLFAAARLAQLVLPHMRARKSGKIIMISSVGGKIFSPLGGWYSTSKFALEGYSDTLRNEVRGFGIDVVVIQPGAIQTEFLQAISEAKRLSSQGAYGPLFRAFDRAMAGVGAMSPPSVITTMAPQSPNRSPTSKLRCISVSASGLRAAPLITTQRPACSTPASRATPNAWRAIDTAELSCTFPGRTIVIPFTTTSKTA